MVAPHCWPERGRVASLQLRYQEAAKFLARAAEAVAFKFSILLESTLAAARALYDQGWEFGDTAALHEAVAVYGQALSIAPRELAPTPMGDHKNNLGNVLRALGARESGTAHLEEAVVAYRAALEEQTRNNAPLDWAIPYNNLGSALATSGRAGERDAAF